MTLAAPSSPARSKKAAAMEVRLAKALRLAVVGRGLPYDVEEVGFRDDGTAWARLAVALDYSGSPIRPEDIAAGMVDVLVNVAHNEAPPKEAIDEAARAIARERRRARDAR